MHYTDITALMEVIRKEDTTFYLTVINKVTEEKMRGNDVFKMLNNMTASELSKLTDAQVMLLKQMEYAFGERIHTYGRTVGTPLYDRWNALPGYSYSFFNKLAELPSTDLPCLSLYSRSQWKKSNGSTSSRAVRGTGLEFTMDEFSLAVFKGSVTKPFLRTEGKNLIIQVNKGFDNVPPIRNRFYKVILDNTEYHTKAMINTLQLTRVDRGDGKYYNAREDEALAISIQNNASLQSLSGPSDTYSNDLTIVTSGKTHLSSREASRVVVAASILTTINVATANPNYLVLARRLLSNVPDKQQFIEKTKSAAILHDLLQEGNTNES